MNNLVMCCLSRINLILVLKPLNPLKMKISSIKQKKIFHSDVVSERNFTSVKKSGKRNSKPSVFNKKQNPLSFVVDWQLSDKQE